MRREFSPYGFYDPRYTSPYHFTPFYQAPLPWQYQPLAFWPYNPQHYSNNNAVSITLSPQQATMPVSPNSTPTRTQHHTFPLTRILKKYAGEHIPNGVTSTLHNAAKYLDDFLKTVLTTEKPNPKTAGMAEMAQSDTELPNIIAACNQVDIDMLEQLRTDTDGENPLTSHDQQTLITNIRQTIATGGKIIIMGCGASGRAALSIEKFAREQLSTEYAANIIGVIAGGDFALVRAIEYFEDNGEYALKQLDAQGFNSERDLLIGLSASGSAKFIKDAIRAEANLVAANKKPAHLKPWLICSNDIATLKEAKQTQFEQAKRSNPNAQPSHPLIDCADNMHQLGLNIGCSLASSTRMQPATATLIALWKALHCAAQPESPSAADDDINGQLQILQNILQDPTTQSQLADLIKIESDCYDNDNMMLYRSSAELAMTIFTDLTERSPTFKLPKIENQAISQSRYSPCSLSINNTISPTEAYTSMLGREPTCLCFDDEPNTQPDRIAGFDFSQHNLEDREKRTGSKHEFIDIHYNKEDETLTFRDATKHSSTQAPTFTFRTTGLQPFFVQILLKMLLNTHSTLVMGRQGKFKDNLMTNLNVSNAKLFARVVRLVKQEVARQLDTELDHINPASPRFSLYNTWHNEMANTSIKMTEGTQAIAVRVAERIILEKIAPESIDSNTTIVKSIADAYLQRLYASADDILQAHSPSSSLARTDCSAVSLLFAARACAGEKEPATQEEPTANRSCTY